MPRLASWLGPIWHGPAGWLLAPFAAVFATAVALRRLAYRCGLLASRRFPVPVLVVGNITVGGTGKTPLTIWLARLLREHGYRPGVACNGYGGTASRWPQQVRPDADPFVVGDEAVLVARHAGCPVAAGPDRVAVVAGLLQHHGCDVIVCDDGLQHLALARDIEIAVVDGRRRFGNGLCLPAGPLREPRSRLRRVDVVVANGAARRGEVGMELRAGRLRQVCDESACLDRRALRAAPVHAVAGIGHPARFFEELRNLGFTVLPHAFPDHYRYAPSDIRFADELPVVMTEKDAVKCRLFADGRHWFLPVEAVPQAVLGERILALLKRLPPRRPEPTEGAAGRRLPPRPIGHAD